MITITIVPDQACPECGAYWGHPDHKLNWPNRVKVDNDFRCYNPECRVGFYRDGLVTDIADKCMKCGKYMKCPAFMHECNQVSIKVMDRAAQHRPSPA